PPHFYPLSLHDALPISPSFSPNPRARMSARTEETTVLGDERAQDLTFMRMALEEAARAPAVGEVPIAALIVQGNQVLAQAHNYRDRKSTRLNSSHVSIS